MIEYFDYRLQTQQEDVGHITQKERQLLRELAIKVSEIASHSSQEQKIKLWKKHNRLEKAKPMVLAFPEGAWKELLPYETMTIADPFWRSYEYYLKRLVYRGEQIHDDNIIESVIEVPLVYSTSGWGLEVHTVSRTDERGSVVWESAIKDLKDAEKLKAPYVTIDEDLTLRNVGVVSEVVGDILPVKVYRKIYIDTSIIGVLVRMRGTEQIMLDMVDEPDWLHDVMHFMQQGTMKLMDFVEQEGNITSNDGNDYVGSGGLGYTNELSQMNGKGEKIGFKNCWGFSESQDYDIISPEMYDEFAIQYQIPLLERYGLNCYGCCESLNQKFDVVKKIPQLRRVSVSPWTDPAKAAAALEDKYIISWKPNPAQLVGGYNTDMLRKEIKRTLEVTKGCIVEMILKDTHTVEYHPERINEWVDISQELASDGYKS